MILTPATRSGTRRPRGQKGSVLIIVIWVAFGLVSLALYFAHSMSFELRAADNRVSNVEAEQAIIGAARYVSNVLANVEEPGLMPDLLGYRSENVTVGDATFWLIGRHDRQRTPEQPMFGLVDEASKLNLNTATPEMLEGLLRMTPEFSAAIIDWRDTNDLSTNGGSESQLYARLIPPYRCKNTNFESVEELRLIPGAQLDVLYGEDANLNGVLDLNENDADINPPNDNRDSRLDPGIFEYVTVYSREPAATTRTNLSDQAGLRSLLQETFSSERAQEIMGQLGGAPITSVLQFYIRSGMEPAEFERIEGQVVVTNRIEGLINVNTASEAVLACIPGIGTENAAALLSRRQSNPNQTGSLAWVKDVLEGTNAVQAGPYLTGRSFQFTADIAAVGHHGRGYQRVKYVFDTSEGTPRIIYRQDRTHLGWALGREVRDYLQSRDTTLARTLR